MQILLDYDHFKLEYDEARQIVVIRRSARPFESVSEIPKVFENLIAAVRPYRNKPALSDLRQARGNNDPQVEAALNPMVTKLNSLFPVFAVLVQTAAGKLQLQRLARERGESPVVFTDEAAALAYLATQNR
jgi:hypothetical protein